VIRPPIIVYVRMTHLGYACLKHYKNMTI